MEDQGVSTAPGGPNAYAGRLLAPAAGAVHNQQPPVVVVYPAPLQPEGMRLPPPPYADAIAPDVHTPIVAANGNGNGNGNGAADLAGLADARPSACRRDALGWAVALCCLGVSAVWCVLVFAQFDAIRTRCVGNFGVVTCLSDGACRWAGDAPYGECVVSQYLQSLAAMAALAFCFGCLSLAVVAWEWLYGCHSAARAGAAAGGAGGCGRRQPCVRRCALVLTAIWLLTAALLWFLPPNASADAHGGLTAGGAGMCAVSLACGLAGVIAVWVLRARAPARR